MGGRPRKTGRPTLIDKHIIYLPNTSPNLPIIAPPKGLQANAAPKTIIVLIS
jgi:hypothetical protein